MSSLVLTLLFFSILSQFVYSCGTCSSTKNQVDCETGRAPCVWKNSTCSVIATNCSAITNENFCIYSPLNNLKCLWSNNTNKCQDVQACSSYNSSSDCYQVPYCEFNISYKNITNCSSIYNCTQQIIGECIDKTEPTVPLSDVACENQNSSWCGNSSTNTSKCYRSRKGICKSVSKTTQCIRRDQRGCEEFTGCHWNSTIQTCQETNCQSFNYCHSYIKLNGHIQMCKNDTAGTCQPITVDQFDIDFCHLNSTYLTYNEASNKCEVCSDYMDSVSYCSSVELSNDRIRNIIAAMVFVIGISLM